ncbi:MAG TPA: hypothetical protein VF886_09120 [Roseiarcus sp.]
MSCLKPKPAQQNRNQAQQNQSLAQQNQSRAEGNPNFLAPDLFANIHIIQFIMSNFKSIFFSSLLVLAAGLSKVRSAWRRFLLLAFKDDATIF